MNQEILFRIIQDYIASLEANMDYLEQLSQKETWLNQNKNIILLIKNDLTILKKTEEKDIGRVLEIIGQKLLNYDIPYAIPYGKAVTRLGNIINQNQVVDFKDLNLIVESILKELKDQNAQKDEKEGSTSDSIRFWEGFLKSINKGKVENISVPAAIRKAIKENHWPMIRSEIPIEMHVIFFCTRIAMTTYLNNT